MKKRFKRSLALILALVMVFGFAPNTMASGEGAQVPEASTDSSYIELTCGEEYANYYNKDDEHLYTFTPEQTDYYRIYSTGSVDVYASLYQGEDNLDYNDDDGPGLNFRMLSKLTAGTTYIVKVSGYGSSGDYTIGIAVAERASSVELHMNEVGYVGDSTYTNVGYFPEGCVGESYTLSSSDESVAFIEYGNCINLVSPGTVTITATSENGLTDTADLEVKAIAYDPLVLGEEIQDCITKTGEKFFYTYTPTEDGVYSVALSYDNYMNCSITDGEGDYVYGSNHSSTSSYSYKEVTLTAGESIYLCVFGEGAPNQFTLEMNQLVPATGVEILADDVITAYVGNDLDIRAKLLPENALQQQIRIESSNTEIVSAVPFGSYTTLFFEGLGTATITAVSGADLTDTITVQVVEPEAAPLNQSISATLNYTDDHVRYKIVPEVTGTYAFKGQVTDSSFEDTPSIHMVLLDDQCDEVIDDWGNRFELQQKLTAGETYYIDFTCGYEDLEFVDFTFTVDKLEYASSITLNNGKDITGYVGDQDWVSIDFSPEDSIYEDYTYTSSDEAVVEVSEYGELSMLAPGTATITATTEESELTDSITVTVLEREVLSLNALVTGTCPTNDSYDGYVFTPEVSGHYGFFAQSEGGIELGVFDVERGSDYWRGGHILKVDLELEAGRDYLVNVYPWNEDSDYTLKVMEVVAPTGMSIVPDGELKPIPGSFASLDVVFAPENAYDEEVTWTSSDTSKATVNEWGDVTFLAAGEVVITARTESGLEASFPIEIAAITFEEIEIDCTFYDVCEGAAKGYSFTAPHDGVFEFNVGSDDYRTETFLTAADGEVLRNNDGYWYSVSVEAQEGETYRFTVSPAAGDFAEYRVHFVELFPPTYIEITNGEYLKGYVGLGVELDYDYSPNAIWESRTWTSSDTSVATVDEDGCVEFLAPGTVTITVTSRSGLTDSIEIEVVELTYEELELGTVIRGFALRGESAAYSYTVQNDGMHRVLLDSSEYVRVYVYNAEGREVEYNSGHNFSLYPTLEAGEEITIIVTARNYNADFEISINECVPATSVEIETGDLIGYVGNDTWLNVLFGPENAMQEDHEFISSDPTVVEVSRWGEVSFVSAGTATITVVTESGLRDSITVEVRELSYEALTLATVASKVATEKGELHGYSFTAPADGKYSFRTEANKYFECVTYDKDGNEYGYDSGRYVSVDLDMEADETYYFQLSFYEGGTNYSAWVTELLPAESMEIDGEDTLTGFVGLEQYLSVTYYPEDSIYEQVSWESSDPSVVTIDVDGCASFVSVGTATITATSENGLTDTMDVEVVDVPQIYENEVVSNEIQREEYHLYQFVPEETATYTIMSDCNLDVFAALFCDGEWLADDDDGGQDMNFKLQYTLVAGETYQIRIGAYGQGEYSFTISKPVAATNMYLDTEDVHHVYMGERIWVEPIFEPNNAVEEAVTWTFSNNAVAQYKWNSIMPMAPGTTTVTATSESGFTDCFEVTVVDAIPVTLGEAVNNTVSRDTIVYTFTPEETDTYIVSIEANRRFQSEILQSDYEYIDDQNMTSHKYEIMLVKGQSYYFKVNCYQANTTYDFSVNQIVPATGMNLVTTDGMPVGDRLRAYVDDYVFLNTTFLPANGASEPVTWTSSNPAVAIVNNYGEVSAKTAGTATITATSESGLTDSVVVEVVEMPALSLGTWTETTISTGQNYAAYTFVPEVDGNYVFYTTGNYDTFGQLYDSEFEEIDYDYDSGEGPNCKLVASLKAGETYYFLISFEGDRQEGTFGVQVDKILAVADIEILSYPKYMTYYKGADDSIDLEGLAVKVTMEDGQVATWEFYEDSIFNNPVDCGTYGYDEDDDSITAYVAIGDKEVTFELEQVDNPVTGIALVEGQIELIECVNGWENDNGDFMYYTDFIEDWVFKIDYIDGSSALAKVHQRLDGNNGVQYQEDQWNNPWTLEGENYIYASYLGLELKIPITIVENPVESLTLLSAPQATYIWGDLEYGDLVEDDEYYLGASKFDGLSFKVQYKDGTSQIITADDMDLDTWTIQGYDFHAEAKNNPLSKDDVGQIPIVFRYMNHTLEYEATLVASPVASVEIVKAPNVVDFVYGTTPDYVGTIIEITYTDGTSKQVEVTRDGARFAYFGTTYIDVDGHELMIMDTYNEKDEVGFRVDYLGASDEFYSLNYADAEIAAVELVGHMDDMNGSTIKVTYADGKAKTYTVNWLAKREQEYTGYGVFDGGDRLMYLEYYYNEDKDQVELYLFGDWYECDIPDVQLGDITGDGKMNVRDVMKLKEYLADSDSVVINTAAADMDGNGKLNVRDVMKLKEFLANN